MENLQPPNASELYFFYELDKVVRDMKPPYKIDYAIKDFGHSLGLVLKEEQIMSRPQSQIEDIMEWAQQVAFIIKAKGIECFVIGRKSLDESKGLYS